MPKLFIPPDSITSKMLDVATRRKLNGLNNDTSIIAEQVVRSILEIPICGVISTTNITLSGVQTVDGVSTASIELICVNGQTTQTENGVYLVGAGVWTRYENMTAGCLVRVIGGTVNKLTWWNNDNTVLNYGTTNITFSYLLSDASIATLTDVTLTSLANGQILLYDSSSGKWINSTYAGLPSGTTNQTLWHNGTAWEATSAIQKFILAGGREFKVNSALNSNSTTNRSTDTLSEFVARLNGISSNDATLTAGATRTELNLKRTVASVLYYVQCQSGSLALPAIIVARSTAPAATYFSVGWDGKIVSDYLTASTVLTANASKEIVSLANPASDKILAYESSALTWVDKPKNHYSFNPANATFQNLNSGATTLTVIPNFKVALSANKRYAIECTVYLATGTAFDIADNDFNLQLIGNTNWLSSNKLIAHHELIINRALGNTYMPQFSGLETDIMCTVYNTTPGILYGSLTIRGHIDTGANADDLELFCHVVSTGHADNTKPVVIAEGSYIKAVECSIN